MASFIPGARKNSRPDLIEMKITVVGKGQFETPYVPSRYNPGPQYYDWDGKSLKLHVQNDMTGDRDTRGMSLWTLGGSYYRGFYGIMIAPAYTDCEKNLQDCKSWIEKIHRWAPSNICKMINRVPVSLFDKWPGLERCMQEAGILRISEQPTDAMEKMISEIYHRKMQAK